MKVVKNLSVLLKEKKICELRFCLGRVQSNKQQLKVNDVFCTRATWLLWFISTHSKKK